MSTVSDKFKILRCLQKQEVLSLSIEEIFNSVRLSALEFEEAKRLALEEGAIFENGGRLCLNENAKRDLDEIDKAWEKFIAVDQESNDRETGKLKRFKTVYRHGKFYNKTDGSRLIFKEGAVFDLEVYIDNLLEADPYNIPAKEIESFETLEMIEKKHYHSFKKIANKGDKFFFTINAGKKTHKGGYHIQCEFTGRLLSDLYLFWKLPESVYGLVFSSPCVVEETSGSIENFEPINAYSLNDAYTKTFEWYFGLYGKSTVNVYNNFCIARGNRKKLLAEFRVR